jgi:hypothetical protein
MQIPTIVQKYPDLVAALRNEAARMRASGSCARNCMYRSLYEKYRQMAAEREKSLPKRNL